MLRHPHPVDAGFPLGTWAVEQPAVIDAPLRLTGPVGRLASVPDRSRWFGLLGLLQQNTAVALIYLQNHIGYPKLHVLFCAKNNNGH